MTSTIFVSRQSPGVTLCRAALITEMLVLLGFAGVWLLTRDIGSDLSAQMLLLALAALGMGMQAATVLALNIPGVATNALTGTFTLIARVLSRRAIGASTPAEVSVGYLLLLCAAYGCSAGIVVLTIAYKATAMAPAGILAIVVLMASRSRRSEPPAGRWRGADH